MTIELKERLPSLPEALTDSHGGKGREEGAVAHLTSPKHEDCGDGQLMDDGGDEEFFTDALEGTEAVGEEKFVGVRKRKRGAVALSGGGCG